MATQNTQLTRDPVGYLSRNVIAIDYSNAVAGVNRWVLVLDGGVPPAMLRLARGDEVDTFAAYFLPYSDNNSHHIRLGSAANLMFTPPLTGCSFAIENKWYTPMVSHHNRQTAGGSIDQPAVNTAITNLHGASRGFLSISANYYAVRKSDYVPDGEDAQNHRLYVVGVYGNLGWTMYRMKHDPMAGVVVEAPQRIN